MNHPLRNFQRGPTWSSNNDPLVARNRIMDDLQFLPGIRMKSIVDRDSGTIGILECCSITTEKQHRTARVPGNCLFRYSNPGPQFWSHQRSVLAIWERVLHGSIEYRGRVLRLQRGYVESGNRIFEHY